MSLFNKIRAGELSKEAFQRQLSEYETKRIELMHIKDTLGADIYKSKLRELDFSISMIQIFIDKFEDIKTA